MITKKQIKELLYDIMECDEEQLTENTNLYDIGFDSLKLIDLILKLEEKENIEFRDSDLDLEKFKDIATIHRTLRKYEFNNRNIKSFIFDCDGVMWNGVAGEAGEDAPYFVEDHKQLFCLMHKLRLKGYMLALCSKNEKENVFEMINKSGICVDDFAIIRTNVDNKPNAIQQIASDFGVFVENIIYIDDNLQELEYIRYCIPEMCSFLHNDIIETCLLLQDIQADEQQGGTIDRTKLFLEEKERKKVRPKCKSYIEYNKILNTTLVSEIAEYSDIQRLSELSKRANRFNLSGNKYDIDDLQNILNDKRYYIYKLSARDDYGDMGIVGMAILKINVLENFIMSCRVLGRGFENNLLNFIISKHGNKIKGIYKGTTKNSYCKDFYLKNGIEYETKQNY